MGMRINDTIPDLTVETDQGPISLHDWIGGGWAVIVSLPKDSTLVRTTEFGAVAQLDAEWKQRGVKVLGVSVDGVEDHVKWTSEILIMTPLKPTFPVVADKDLTISKAFDMLPAEVYLPAGRMPSDTAVARTVAIIGPDKKVKLSIAYPMTVGRNFSEILRAVDALQTSAGQGVATLADWESGDDIIISAR
jgi:alkyl hydroperoxide reductase subunit AhpC